MNVKFLPCALEAAQAGAKVLQKYWGKLKTVERKSSHSDLVTIADKEAEAAIISHIRHYFPSHGFLGEESGLEKGSNEEYQWIIDPLDGTTNYTHSYPIVSISIGLAYKSEVIVAVVYNPFLEELFHAVKGEGAFLNGDAIFVSGTEELSSSLLATGFAYDRLKSPETNYTEFTYFTQLTQGVRRAGSAALDLAYVAAGRLDGYWERGLQPWDIAAGSLLVTEAGGKVSSYSGNTFDLFSGKILASNGVVHVHISKGLTSLSNPSFPN